MYNLNKYILGALQIKQEDGYYFFSRFTEKQKQEFVIKAVEHYHRYLMRQRDAR